MLMRGMLFEESHRRVVLMFPFRPSSESIDCCEFLVNFPKVVDHGGSLVGGSESPGDSWITDLFSGSKRRLADLS